MLRVAAFHLVADQHSLADGQSIEDVERHQLDSGELDFLRTIRVDWMCIAVHPERLHIQFGLAEWHVRQVAESGHHGCARQLRRPLEVRGRQTAAASGHRRHATDR